MFKYLDRRKNREFSKESGQKTPKEDGVRMKTEK